MEEKFDNWIGLDFLYMRGIIVKIYVPLFNRGTLLSRYIPVIHYTQDRDARS